MSPQKPTPEHNDEPREFNGLAEILYEAAEAQRQYELVDSDDLTNVVLAGAYNLVEMAQDVIDALKGYGYELTTRVPVSELGVTKGLPELAAEAGIGALNRLVAGLAPEVPPLPSKPEGGFQHAGQEAGKGIAGALELGPDAIQEELARSDMNRTGHVTINSELPNAPQWVKQLLGQHDPLTAALELIGRRTDIVAVQLPEPDNGVWYINEHGGNVHLGPVAGQMIIDAGAILWGINTDEARTLAAALLAAANVADAAEDGGK